MYRVYSGSPKRRDNSLKALRLVLVGSGLLYIDSGKRTGIIVVVGVFTMVTEVAI